MTTFYRFASQAEFIAKGGKPEGEYTQAGIGVSVIGDHYEPGPDPLPEDYVPTYVGYLVNTTAPIDGWSAYAVTPAAPMRIFG